MLQHLFVRRVKLQSFILFFLFCVYMSPVYSSKRLFLPVFSLYFSTFFFSANLCKGRLHFFLFKYIEFVCINSVNLNFKTQASGKCLLLGITVRTEMWGWPVFYLPSYCLLFLSLVHSENSCRSCFQGYTSDRVYSLWPLCVYFGFTVSIPVNPE